MRYNLAWLTFILLLTPACGEPIPILPQIDVKEVSGIARMGDKLLLVGDDADGRYYELTIDDPTARIIPIDREKVREIIMPGAALAMDLESIDILADDRPAVLSEQLRCLIAQANVGSGDYTVAAEYDKIYAEFANRGLEGLAVKNTGEGGSMVAVLWEGGYPEMKKMNPQLREKVGRFPMKPIIIVHELKNSNTTGWVSHPLSCITLQVPEPAGEIPAAQRFRGTDLVWHTWHDRDVIDTQVEGFIVLLSSENSPTDTTGREYRFKQLQRYNLDGRAVGEPLDLTKICRDALINYFENRSAADQVDMHKTISDHMKNVMTILENSNWQAINWEGLDWFEEGESLVAIYDTHPLDPPFAMVLDIPDDWR